MNERRRLSWDRPAGVLTIVMALGLAGCGNSLGTSGKTAASADTETPVAPPVATKGRAKAKLSPGGDQGVRERWNKKKEQPADK
ncbi:MAG: hypothetical protein ACYC61_30450 [Isosphaeraceae bacterium]